MDLGCGTGRNTLKLLALDGAQIVELDASPKMLDVARLRCRNRTSSSLVADAQANAVVQLELFDMLSGEDLPGCAENAIGVVSTLVLEHIPAADFFESVNSLLVPGGYLLVTNMHPEMGAKPQAGFQDPRTGEKIRTLSSIHDVEDVVRVAGLYNLELVDRVLERVVNQEDIAALGRRAEKWVGVCCWFGAIFRKSTMNLRNAAVTTRRLQVGQR